MGMGENPVLPPVHAQRGRPDSKYEGGEGEDAAWWATLVLTHLSFCPKPSSRVHTAYAGFSFSRNTVAGMSRMSSPSMGGRRRRVAKTQHACSTRVATVPLGTVRSPRLLGKTM